MATRSRVRTPPKEGQEWWQRDSRRDQKSVERKVAQSQDERVDPRGARREAAGALERSERHAPGWPGLPPLAVREGRLAVPASESASAVDARASAGHRFASERIRLRQSRQLRRAAVLAKSAGYPQERDDRPLLRIAQLQFQLAPLSLAAVHSSPPRERIQAPPSAGSPSQPHDEQAAVR